MKLTKMRRMLSLLISAAVAATLLSYGAMGSAAGGAVDSFGIINSTSFIRSSASAVSGSNKILNASGDAITLTRGAVVPIIGEVQPDPNDKSHTEKWYRIKYINMSSGTETECYVYSENVTKRTAVQYSVTDEEFEKSIENFPESYRPYLRAIHAVYPTWSFTAQKTGVDFYKFAKLQSEIRKGDSESASFSFIRNSRTNKEWRASDELVDGRSCYMASEAVVSYYIDPRNFLNEVDIMQFEQLGYDENHQTIEGVEKLLTNSFMENKTVKNLAGEEISYAQAYMDAAKKSGVSPYSLAISTILENGKSGTKLTLGTEKYFNFFGIGSTPGGNPQNNGLSFAKTGGSWSAELKEKCLIPWDTAYKAIVGGAVFMGTSYISIGQDTPYYKKFDVFSAADGTTIHQYMQSVEYPVDEARQAYNNYSSLGLLADARNFVIPVYDNMPKDPPALPGTSQLIIEIPDSEAPILSTVYDVNSGIISNVSPETTAEDFKTKLNINPKATLSISTESAIGTGTQVTVTMDGTSNTYTVVIRGDLNGDGIINTVDLLYVRNFILETSTLTDTQKLAADIDSENSVNIADLLKLRNHILNNFIISQENVN